MKALSRSHYAVAWRRLFGSVLLALSLALGGVPAVPALASEHQRAHIDEPVLQLMKKGRPAPVILVTRGDVNKLFSDLHRGKSKWPVRVPIAHGVAAVLSPARIAHYAADPNIVRIVYDAPVRLSDTPYSASRLVSIYPEILDASSLWSNSSAPLTGNGIGVAVIDSGVQAVPDLGNRVLVNLNFNPNVTTANDDYGHGTAIAGIIGSNGTADGGQYIGIAPQVNLLNLRVNDGTGSAPASAIMNAIIWAVNNRATYNIRVINLSLVSTYAESYTTSALDAAVEFAWLKGIAVVVAAGNSGSNSLLYAPANDPYVITVGATDDHNTQNPNYATIATFSSYGITQDGFLKPDVVAPGRYIVSDLAAGSYFALNYPTYMVGTQYIRLAGTSMSAAEVSGVSALYLEAHPGTHPAQLKAVLAATANKFGSSGLPAGAGAGYPDAKGAINYWGLVGTADLGLIPNNYLKIMYMMANSLTSTSTVSWDSVSWDSVSWDSVSWDSVSWNAVSWSSVSWGS